MQPKDLITIKSALLKCAAGDVTIAERLHIWWNAHVKEATSVRTYGKSDLVRFKTTEDFTRFRLHNLIELHLKAAEVIHHNEMAIVHSQPLPGDLLEDRVRIMMLGLPNGG